MIIHCDNHDEYDALPDWLRKKATLITVDGVCEKTDYPLIDFIETTAQLMAEAVNGGVWDVDYTEHQKRGWRLKAKWARGLYREDWLLREYKQNE